MRQAEARLTDALHAHAGRTLFDCADGGRVSYADVLELGEQPAFKTARRRLVFCISENDPGGLTGYLALLSANAVPLMLGAGTSPLQLQPLIDAYQPGLIWLPCSRVGEFPSAKPLLIHGDYCLLETGEQAYPVHDSLALLMSTSGSTGSPKFVRLSHANLLGNAQAIAQYLELTADEVPITTLPPSYTYGLSIIHSHLLVGSRIALTNQSFFDRGFWGLLKAAGATSLGGVPYHYEILKRLRFTRMELPSLRTLTQAGGRMAPELTQEYAAHCAAHGMRFFTMYGQAEATARIAYLPPEKALAKAGSIGIAIPGGRLWIEDEHGQVQQGTEAVGELVYQGGNVSMGYARGYADLAREDERGGILRTGDMARRDAEGDYHIIGRLKRFLKLFGHRVNLQDIEQWLLEAGHAVACAGRDDRLEIYQPLATPEAAKEIKAKVVKHIKVAPGAVRVIGIGALPRNDAGKIRYADLAAQAGEILA